MNLQIREIYKKENGYKVKYYRVIQLFSDGRAIIKADFLSRKDAEQLIKVIGMSPAA